MREHRPIVFIRFNPDNYVDKDGKKISSCWKVNGYGVMQVSKTKIVEWDRLQESEDTQSQFTEDEEHMIIVEAMQILLDKLDVDEDEFEDHEQHVDWMRFDDIIGHYVCYVQ